MKQAIDLHIFLVTYTVRYKHQKEVMKYTIQLIKHCTGIQYPRYKLGKEKNEHPFDFTEVRGVKPICIEKWITF